MPELPEVETIRRDLHEQLAGDCVQAVEVLCPDVIIGAPDELAPALEGQCITGSGRRGKVMWFDFSGGPRLYVHLRMSGQLLIVDTLDAFPVHTHVAFMFRSGRRLIYVDPRRFGRLEFTVSPVESFQPKLLCNVGMDAIAAEISPEYLSDLARGHRIGIKEFLLDQTHIAGIGNIYASEILYHAGIHPTTPANRVESTEMQRIVEATRNVLACAIRACGTTLADHQYQTALGWSGEYQNMLRVYARENQPCRKPQCEGIIQRIVTGQRSTYFCPICQRAEKNRRTHYPRCMEY